MKREDFEKSGRNHLRAANLHKELADFHGRRSNEVESKEHEAKHCALCDRHAKKQVEHDKIGRALLKRVLGKVAAHERAKKIAEHVREIYGNPEHNSFRPEKAREAIERAIGEIHPRLTVKGLRGAARRKEERHDFDEDLERREHEVKASAAPTAEQHYRAAGYHSALTDHHAIMAHKAPSETISRAHTKLSNHHQAKADAHIKAGVRKDGGAGKEDHDNTYNHAHKFGEPGSKGFDHNHVAKLAKAALTSNPYMIKASGELSPVSKLSKKEQAAAHVKLGTLHAHLRDHAVKRKNYDSALKHSEKSINHHDVAHKININAPATHDRLKRSAEANIVKHFGKGTDEHFRSHEAAKAASHIRKSLYGR